MVSCLPSNIPNALTIDISQLTAEHHILHARDLIIPANVKLAISADDAVVMVSRTRAAVSEDTGEAATTSTVAEPEAVIRARPLAGEELPPEDTKRK
ncbi:MAG: hypothetical protein IPO15_16000 [Anaerolineae bacterium]|uniref:hypothetical protein n=1 Tax=Candidatus Amarolinea dominans TaxID=3140696 RepID=UPI003135202E|nr:hypothetical protein [Anaerolineae bacterium]